MEDSGKPGQCAKYLPDLYHSCFTTVGCLLFFSGNKKNEGILLFSPSAAGAGQQSQSAGSQNQEDGRLILPQLDRGGRYYIVS
jgi:hypothetical protein